MASLPLIEIVKRQATATFSKLANGVTSSFDENLSTLKHLMNKVTSLDVNLDSALLQPIPKGMERICPPVTYIEVLDDPQLTIGIFVLRPGARLPLHDHPLMYGILKVIHGSVNIQSYSILPEKGRYDLNNEHTPVDFGCELNPRDISLTEDTFYKQVIITARKEPATVVNEADSVCFLSPIKSNLHEIQSVNGAAAFLDILAPPYNTDIPGVGPRPCRYFMELEDKVPASDERLPLRRLLRIPSPPDFWSQSAPYQGP